MAQVKTPAASPPSCAREGDLLVVRNQAHLPKKCIKCSAPADGKAYKLEFTWNPHGLKTGRNVASVTTALATNRRGKVYGYYCDRHRPKTMKFVGICLGMLLMGVGSFGGAVSVGLESSMGLFLFIAGFILGGGALLALAFYFAWPPLGFECMKIEDESLWLDVRHKGMLDGLPVWKQAPAPSKRSSR